MLQVSEYLQLGSNGLALLVAGWIYLAYIKNLRSSVSAKDEQLKILQKHLDFWKDKADEFEKKTPEYIEEVLAKRIRHREEEIKRLDEDKESSFRILQSKTSELTKLKSELEKAIYFGRALTYYDLDRDEDIIIPESEIELEYLGDICVDSASILITDPMYVENEWTRGVEYSDEREYLFTDNGEIYKFREDFDRYDEILPDIGSTPNDLIVEGRFEKIAKEGDFTYSLPGSMHASSSQHGFGTLNFNMGHSGAGICLKTVYGDGRYPIFGERYKGKIYRVYIELQ
ncbi:hypothetical protein [Stutzerimonas stutzeri]|uniref:hypothetical protein n=1 Tax=Stutzerimonas stutzeri TaxID=316 RepID=UPI000C9AD378|nr:hypothetical protein [Stutzerimonas stutzeri]PNG14361.1 hypothetical protein CXK97_08820 [Stutzerimonas stutzeri]